MTAGAAYVALAPAMGGGIARLEVGGKPVLRPWAGDDADPFSLACNVLLPFSNRISRGGFTWRGEFYPLRPNLEGDPFPIHGDGLFKPWEIIKSGPCALMTLPDGAFGPWRYCAQQEVSLTSKQLEIRLSLTNLGRISLPFGVGFHPWFPRSLQTEITFPAKTVWLEDSAHLPTQELHLSDAPGWGFDCPRKLPATWINNCYSGWPGFARINQGNSGVSCTITCDHSLQYALVFSPGAASDFFCFEPVSHPVDSFHLPGQPGLTELATGSTLTSSIAFSWE